MQIERDDIDKLSMEDPDTHFAPAKRSTDEEIRNEFELVGSQIFFTEIFGTIAGIAAVIDSNRQIVFANDEFLSLLGMKSIESILGKRPGEVVSCIHSGDEPSGCGTSLACAYCGAVNAIMESQKTGKKSTKETRISTFVGGKQNSLDLNVTSTPIVLTGNVFYVLMLQDISNEKRRNTLERIFFHDLLNTVSGLNGILSILKEGTDPEEARELINISEEASREIVEEIVGQRQLRAAESGEMILKIEKVNAFELLSSAIKKIGLHESGQKRRISYSVRHGELNFETDKILLQRVLVNLLKNALEASPEEGIIEVGIEDLSNSLRFWIKNNGVMTEDIQLQLFQRSFSTKGNSRGLGTYSIKLLTENYLKGKVSFVSNETDGTIFRIELNKKFPADSADQRR